MLKNTGLCKPLLNVASVARAAGPKPLTQKEKRIFIMKSKKQILDVARQLSRFIIGTLEEVKQWSEEELEALKKALGVEDFEQIENAKIYGLALDQDFNIEQLKRCIDEFKDALKDLEDINL